MVLKGLPQHPTLSPSPIHAREGPVLELTITPLYSIPTALQNRYYHHPHLWTRQQEENNWPPVTQLVLEPTLGLGPSRLQVQDTRYHAALRPSSAVLEQAEVVVVLQGPASHADEEKSTRGEVAEREATKWGKSMWRTWGPHSLLEGRDVGQGSNQSAVYSSLKCFRATWTNTPPAWVMSSCPSFTLVGAGSILPVCLGAVSQP